MCKKTFEFYFSEYSGQYLLYLDPYYLTTEDIIAKKDVTDITYYGRYYLRRRNRKIINLPVEYHFEKLLSYFETYQDDKGRLWLTDKIKINGSITISKIWWDELYIVADKEVIQNVINKHSLKCKPKELEVLDKLLGNPNFYVKINRDSTIETKAISCNEFKKYMSDPELHEEKSKDIIDYYESTILNDIQQN